MKNLFKAIKNIVDVNVKPSVGHAARIAKGFHPMDVHNAIMTTRIDKDGNKESQFHPFGKRTEKDDSKKGKGKHDKGVTESA